MNDISEKEKEEETKELLKIELGLSQLIKVNKVNLEAQQIYLDILKGKKKKIDSSYIKNIYQLFSQNKSRQILFQKQLEKCHHQIINHKAIIRLYIRLFEIGMKKIAYYWLNSKYLEFLSPSILIFSKQMQHSIKKMHTQTLEIHIQFLRLYYQQNILLQQYIYNLLIDFGFLASMDQFYRINGIGCTSKEFYQIKNTSQRKIKINKYLSHTSDYIGKNEKTFHVKEFKTKKQNRFVRKSRNSQPFVKKIQEYHSSHKKIKAMFDSYIPSLSKAIKIINNSNQEKLSIKNIMNGDNFYYEDSIVGENEEKKKNSFRKSVLTKSVTLAFSHDFIDYLDESEKLTLEKASYMLLKNQNKHINENKTILKAHSQNQKWHKFLKNNYDYGQLDFNEKFLKEKKFQITMNNMVNSKKYLPMKMSKCYESKNKVNNNETLSHELHLNSWKPCHQILFNEDGRNVSDTSMKKCERKTHEINQGLKISEPLKNRTKYVIFNCRSRNLIYH